MKRELEESDDDERQQVAIAALVYANFSFTLANVTHLLHAFRFHPRRLLALMTAAPDFAKAVNSVVQQYYPTFWYDSCLCAFPGFIILLQAFSLNYDWNKLPRTSSGWFPWLSSMGDRGIYPHKATDPIVVETCFQGLRKRKYTIYSCCDVFVDRSFYDQQLLDTCLHNEVKARETAQCFKMMAPFGVPPAQYCFASQMALHRLTMEFIALVDNRLNTPNDIKRGFTIISDAAASSRAAGWMQRITVDVLDSLRKLGGQAAGQSYIVNGRGPRFPVLGSGGPPMEGHIGGDYLGREFTLSELMGLMRECDDQLRSKKPEKRQRGYHGSVEMKELYDRVVQAHRRYSLGEIEPVTAIDGSELQLEMETINQQRLADLERYGTHDPLYWSVLLSGEESALNYTGDWKTIILQLIAMLIEWKHDPTSESELIRLSCSHCSRSNVWHVESVAPFNAYCDSVCQKKGHNL